MPKDPHISVPVFVLLEKDVFIAEDVTDLILDSYPDADIRTAKSGPEALDVIRTLDSIDVAVLNGAGAAPDIFAIIDDLHARGAQVVLIGDGAVSDDVAPSPQTKIIRGPFTSEMMHDAIELAKKR